MKSSWADAMPRFPTTRNNSRSAVATSFARAGVPLCIPHGDDGQQGSASLLPALTAKTPCTQGDVAALAALGMTYQPQSRFSHRPCTATSAISVWGRCGLYGYRRLSLRLRTIMTNLEAKKGSRDGNLGRGMMDGWMMD